MGGLALLAATLLAREQATELVAEQLRRVAAGSATPPTDPIRSWEYYGGIRDLFSIGYGFWLVSGALFLIGMTNVALAVPGREPDPL